MEYDLIIIGGGPAACAAAVYAGRKQLKTLMIAEEIGGQSAVSETIYNWIGTPAVSGNNLAKMLQSHVEEYSGEKGTVTLSIGKKVVNVVKDDGVGFMATLGDGSVIRSRAVLVSTGSRRRKLQAAGAEQFDNKGVMYCATCDGPLFSGMNVAVAGGGNAAFEAALQMSQYAAHITLIHRNDNFKADPITIDQVQNDPKVTIIPHAEILSIEGKMLVEKLTYRIKDDQTVQELPISGIFVEIGQLPNTELVAEITARDASDRIIVDPYNQRTSVDGLWAAGDCTNGHYHQNNIAMGDAIKAIEDIYLWIKRGGK